MSDEMKKLWANAWQESGERSPAPKHDGGYYGALGGAAVAFVLGTHHILISLIALNQLAAALLLVAIGFGVPAWIVDGKRQRRKVEFNRILNERTAEWVRQNIDREP